MLRIAALVACVATATAFAPGAMTARPMQLRATLPQAAARPAAKASLRMGLEDITDTSGTLGGFKWIGAFGASFVPSLFLCGYFLGGYYPPMALGASEPDWWPTAMQYSHGVNKATLGTNVARLRPRRRSSPRPRPRLRR